MNTELQNKAWDCLPFNKGDRVVVAHGKYITQAGIIETYSSVDNTWAVILDGLDYPINFDEEDIITI